MTKIFFFLPRQDINPPPFALIYHDIQRNDNRFTTNLLLFLSPGMTKSILEGSP